MSYLRVISLSDAKEYLRVDDTLTEDDNHIQRMINASFDYIERWTNINVFDRQKTYILINGCAKVYDYPINSVVSTFDVDTEVKHGFTNYTAATTETEIKLNVGYQNVSNIPNDLVDVAYEIIDLLYYANETGKGMKDLSELSVNVLNKHKRFVF